MSKTITNNLGAISALKGYRLQFLYTLYRILSYKESESEFHPEGEFEDLDVYSQDGKVIEIIQVKDLGKVLTLSDITTTKKDNTFLKRSVRAFNEGSTPTIKLVSFGQINEDVKNLAKTEYSESLIKKLKRQGLNQKEIDILKGNFKYETVTEQNVENDIFSSIEKWGTFADIHITLDLLIYWIYYSAEKQFTITPNHFKSQFDKICKFQRERISFGKTFNSLIQFLDNDAEIEDVENLKLDFYKGISASHQHIMADVDVIREDKLKLIQEEFNETNIVFVHGASGQGKSTLAYRFLYDYCAEKTVLELKKLPEDITTIYDVINSLEGISKGIRFPITIYIDVEPGNKEWIQVLKELGHKKNFNFLVTIREEDWNSIEVGDKFRFSEVELTFEQEEAELIYNALDDFNKDLKFINFSNAWEYFGERGPLLEFVYLITQNESLSSKLNSQINAIRRDNSEFGKEKIKLLRYIVLADCFGSKIKLKELNDFLQLNNEILFLLELLQKEYLIKVSGDKTHIIGLHPVRSKIIKDLLFDNEIYKISEFAIDAIEFISDNTAYIFLRNAFRYGNLQPSKLINHLKNIELGSWQLYFSILKSLLWKGIADYTVKNIDILNEIYESYNNGWKIVVNFDFANVIESGSMMANSELFSEEQRQYAKTINERFSKKDEVFEYCIKWIQSIEKITIMPNGKDEWDSLGLFLFWLNHFKYKSVIVEFENFNVEENLKLQPLKVIAHVLYAFKGYNIESKKYIKYIEQIFLQRLSEKYNIIATENTNQEISCHYLFDIIDESFESEESNFMNAKSMEIIDLLRFAFPDKDQYNTNGIGHKFLFLPSDIDSSVKQIPQKNLPLKPLVEINSTYINLFEYTKRPRSWQEYVDKIITRRILFVDVMTKMKKAFNLYHKQKNLSPLAEYVHTYNVEYHHRIKERSIPSLPQDIIDEWGEYGEGNAKKIKSNFEEPESSNEKNEIKQILASKKYSKFIGLYREFDSANENFLWQSAESIFRKIKMSLNEDVSNISDKSRISLVGNLFKAYETIENFQNEFRLHFEKFVDYKVLQKLERTEFENISSLCFLYRQFIYSSSFVVGNLNKVSLDRLKNTKSNFRKKITNGLKATAKEINCTIHVDFDDNANRCVIIADYHNTIEYFQLVELLYNKLYLLLDQPDYTSIKYLILNSKYPIFNVVILISGKTINSTYYEFKTYNLREKMFDELEQFNLIPQKIPSDINERYNLNSWNNEIEEFKKLDKLLECTSTAFQLAHHFSQLEYFENRDVEEYNEEILKKHIKKIGNLFQENLQNALDLYAYYAEQCNNEKIVFSDDEEKLEFYELLINNHKNFYPNDSLFEKKELKLTLGTEEMKEWIERLEQLVQNISIVYYVLAGKVIEEEIIKNEKSTYR